MSFLTMVAIDPSTARRGSQISLNFLTCRLIVLLGAVAGGIFLVQLKENVLRGGQEIIVEAPAYYNPGLRTRSFGPECRYYLAESAIANGGLGLFSAISISQGKIALGFFPCRFTFPFASS